MFTQNAMSLIDVGLSGKEERLAVPLVKKLLEFADNRVLEINDGLVTLYSCKLKLIGCFDFSALWKLLLKKNFKLVKEKEEGLGFDFEIVLDENNNEMNESFSGCPFCYAKRLF
jgi:hypothetical protein